MRRIIIIGVTGSGKTTLGKALSAKLDIPAIDLDEIHWLPGWQTRGLQESRYLVEVATQQSAWVISGNYSKLQDIFWSRADTVIWLDYTFLRSFWQLLRRSILRMLDQQEICNGNYERWNLFLSRKSIMIWFFQTFRKRRQRGREIFSYPEQHAHLQLIRFDHPVKTATWLERLAHV